jgi:thiol-disulfide isomerase/thioredoxin
MKILSFLFVFLIISCGTAEKLHTEMYNSKEILVGEGTRDDLSVKPYNEWFDANYRDYRPDQSVISSLKPSVNHYKFDIIMGTWCGDSQQQVPVLFKVLDEAGYKHTPNIYFVPRKYKYYKPVKNFGIIRVPTIIVYKNGKEIGRIIEYPMDTIEADLLKIISEGNYRHELDERG